MNCLLFSCWWVGWEVSFRIAQFISTKNRFLFDFQSFSLSLSLTHALSLCFCLSLSLSLSLTRTHYLTVHSLAVTLSPCLTWVCYLLLRLLRVVDYGS